MVITFLLVILLSVFLKYCFLAFKGFDLGQFLCDVCKLAKHKFVSFLISSNTRASTPFTRIHNDVCGPSTVHNISRTHWFVSFVDDCTQMSWVFLLKQKSYVSSTFQNFFHMVKNQFQVEIKRVRSNNARDYFNQVLSPFFKEK